MVICDTVPPVLLGCRHEKIEDPMVKFKIRVGFNESMSTFSGQWLLGLHLQQLGRFRYHSYQLIDFTVKARAIHI